LNIFNAKKSVGGHVEKSKTLSFLMKSNFISHLAVEQFQK